MKVKRGPDVRGVTPKYSMMIHCTSWPVYVHPGHTYIFAIERERGFCMILVLHFFPTYCTTAFLYNQHKSSFVGVREAAESRKNRGTGLLFTPAAL